MQFADGKYYDGSWRENDMDGKGIYENDFYLESNRYSIQ